MDKTYDESKMKTHQKQRIVTPENHWTPRKYRSIRKHQLKPERSSKRQDLVQPQPTKITSFIFWFVNESDARLTGVQLKRTKHADCHSTFIVYAHRRRLCSNWFGHGSTTISNPHCSLTFMLYVVSAICINVVNRHTLFAHMPRAL